MRVTHSGKLALTCIPLKLRATSKAPNKGYMSRTRMIQTIGSIHGNCHELPTLRNLSLQELQFPDQGGMTPTYSLIIDVHCLCGSYS